MSRLGWLFRQRRAERELADEIQSHLDEKVDALVGQGMSRRDATAAAQRAFGNIAHVEETSREVWRPPFLDSVIVDVRHAFRIMRRHPAFSANVIAISALGVAACAATFSLVSGVLLAPLPFPEQERVFELLVRSRDRGDVTAAVPFEGFERIAAGSPVIEAITVSQPAGVTVQWNGEPERLRTRRVSPSFFHVFGVSPMIGRGFTQDEGDASAPVVILGNRLWRERFSADPAVAGQSIEIDRVPRTIIGVMPPAFRAAYSDEPALWLPLRPGGPGSFVNATVRLVPGTPRQRAEAWLAAAVPTTMPFRPASARADAVPVLRPITDAVYGEVERPLHILLAAVALVLALVSANVATLFVSHTSARARELGVRRALGASVARQARQLITESLTLAAIGGLLGTALSAWIVAGIRTLGVRVLPRMDTVTLDWRVLAFAIAATMLTGLIGGLTPALAARRGTSLAPATSRVTMPRTPGALVVVQVTLTVVLLIGAGLLGKGFLIVLPTEPGFAIENRASLQLTLHDVPAYPDSDPAAAQRFVRDVRERMATISGVRDVAAMTFAPFSGVRHSAEISIPGQPERTTPWRANQNIVTTNFFDVMRIPLRRGRAFSSGDARGSAPTVIVNETAARLWWPGLDPIGRLLVIEGRGGGPRTVVGVSGDARLMGGDTRARPEIFLPEAQASSEDITFIVHTDGPPRLFARDLRRAVWSLAPRLPMSNDSDLETIAMESVRRPRFFAWAMGLFAAVAVMLSALAVYGVLTLDVVQRRAEIGIRLALGALPRGVGWSVLKRAMALGGIGVIVGLSIARLASRFIESLLLEVAATDRTVYAVTGVVVLLVAAAAACAPAWRAVRVDPIRSLRVDA